MALLVTSASGINGAGYGKLLAFGESGQLLGPFTEDTRVSDPRGLGIKDGLLLLNSGSSSTSLDRSSRRRTSARASPNALTGDRKATWKSQRQ